MIHVDGHFRKDTVRQLTARHAEHERHGRLLTCANARCGRTFPRDSMAYVFCNDLVFCSSTCREQHAPKVER